MTCTLPAALLLLIWWKRGMPTPRVIISTAPLFVMGAALGLTTVWLEKHHVGARGEYWNLMFVERCLLAGRILWFYAGKLAWPFQNTFIYPRWEVDPRIWRQYLYPLSFIAVVAGLWVLRRRIGRGPLVAVLFYAGTLFPALGFFDVYPMRFSFVADHFQYHAGIGWIVLAAAIGTILIGRAGEKIFPGKQSFTHGMMAMFATLLVSTLGALSWSQAHTYRTQATLWRDTINKNPNAWMAMGNYAYSISRQGRFAEASELFKRYLEIKEKSEIHHIAYFIIGMAHYEKGQIDQAIANYLKALEIDPGYRPAYYQLGIAAFADGDLKAGTAALELAISLEPEDIEMINRVGVFYARQGMLSEAREKFEKAISLQPGNRDALRNLENILRVSTESSERK